MASRGLPDRQNFGMGGRVAVGQRPVAGGGDDLVIPDDHASDRNFARFSGVFGRFQRQIHERRGGHASYHRKKPATRSAFSKSGYRFCVRMRLEQERARYRYDIPSILTTISVPETIHAPRQRQKQQFPAAGVIGPRRQGPLRRRPRPGEEIRQARFWRQGFCRKARRRQAPMASGVRTPANPTAPSRMARNPIRARASPTPASATSPRPPPASGFWRRAASALQPRRPSRAAIVRTVNRARIFARARIAAARSARTRRAAIARATIATTAPRAPGSRRCAPGRTLRREEVRRQAALYAAGQQRREAPLHAARRRFPQGRRPSSWRPAL